MEFFPHPMTFILILFISYFFCLGIAADCGGKNVAYTITVGRNGKVTFKTIQAAIDSIKSNNDQWVKIHIKAGFYTEQVHIPREKPCIILEGENSQNTIINFSDHYSVPQGTSSTGTFISWPSNVIASDITFKNSYNVDDKGNNKIFPAVAASIYGDKTFLLRCSFIGYQDTLFDVIGRHYFKDCYIQGEIDFIFGNGQSYYENCLINAIGRNKNLAGFVTAQSRDSPNDPGGFVFEGGSIVGNGKVNLGRAWRAYSRVIFHNTNFSSVITPQGWNNFGHVGEENKFTYAEVDCKGPGADTSKRVPWTKKLNSAQLQEFSLASFINKDSWLNNLPIIS
ncbi:probable pectinesterase 66 [Cajanus cajan]|uniref:probable pectinesterase 66 n=1 Tax=Cajanus cajan TaxID=3821 RepID=UPI0010FB872E|nr:probable pectinesterase 66 [Cajanus cajan]